MKPTTALLAAAVLGAAAPAAATAKEIQGGRVCGAHGCTPTGRLPIEASALSPPGEGLPPLQPWYRIELRMGDGHRVYDRIRVLWAPRDRLVAPDEKDPRWFPASPEAAAVARRITRGVAPFQAAMMPLHLPPVKAAEVIGPVGTPAAAADASGPPWAPIGGGAAVVLVAGLYRSRRAKPRSASTPTPPT